MKIAVLKGGPSAEREVSLNTGAAVAAALRGAGHEVTEIDPAGPDFDLPNDCDIAFIALHGTFGEDGQVQTILEGRGVPYTGCGAITSARAFDKVVTKRFFEMKGVPSPRFAVCKKGDQPHIPLPVVVKPSRQGSSVGISRVFEASGLAAALELAFQYDEEVLVESFVQGRELTVGILGGNALPVVEIDPKDGFYNYQNKYTPGRTDYHCPAGLSPATTQAVQAAALAAHQSLECEVYSRVDVLLDADEQPWVLEVNTIPGMTATSLLPKAAAAAGIDFPALCERIIQLSLEARKGTASK